MKTSNIFLKEGTYVKGQSLSGLSLEKFVISVLNNPTCCPKTPSYTYVDLKSLATNSQLAPGTYYILSDYITKHEIAGTGLINTNVHNGTAYGAMTAAENAAPTIEPLILFATSKNTFSRTAYSTLYPDDVLEYDFNDTTVLTETRKGYIVNRIDTKNEIQAPYDWRVVKWRRWYIDLTNPAHRTSPGGILDTTTRPGYFCWFSTATTVGNGDVLTPPDVNNFKDVKTFDLTKTVNRTYLGISSSNIVFYDNCVGNQFVQSNDYGVNTNANCTIGSSWGNTFYTINNSIFAQVDTFSFYQNRWNFPISSALIVGIQIFAITGYPQQATTSFFRSTNGWYSVTGDYQDGAGNRRLFIRRNVPFAKSTTFRRFVTNAADTEVLVTDNGVFESCYINSGSMDQETFDVRVPSIGTSGAFANFKTLSATPKVINHHQSGQLYSIENSVSGSTVTTTGTRKF